MALYANWAFRHCCSHSCCVSSNPVSVAKTFKLMSFELEEGEIPSYSELAHGLEQALGWYPTIGGCGPLRMPVLVGC